MGKMINEDGIEYSIFPWTFFFLKLTGFWLPMTVEQTWLRFCYYFYTIFCCVTIIMIFVGILCEILISRENLFVDLVNNWYMLAVCFHILARGLNVARNRSRILRLLQEKLIVKRWTNLRDTEEIAMVESSRIEEQ